MNMIMIIIKWNNEMEIFKEINIIEIDRLKLATIVKLPKNNIFWTVADLYRTNCIFRGSLVTGILNLLRKVRPSRFFSMKNACL